MPKKLTKKKAAKKSLPPKKAAVPVKAKAAAKRVKKQKNDDLPVNGAIATAAKEKRQTKKEINQALQDAAAAAHDAPHIECRLIVGEMSVPVDASSLEHTLGAGMWGHGDGLVDKWPDTVWAGLLAHLGLPAFPLDRTVAERPVKRLVQRLWYEAVQGHVPEARAATFAERDAEAETKYKQDLPKVVEAAAGKTERAKTSFGRARSGVTTYTPTAALKTAIIGGQAAVLQTAFKNVKWGPMTVAEATAGMLKAGLKTSTKPERISGFYLCKWVPKGWLTRGTGGEGVT